jgi:hypothetical protein
MADTIEHERAEMRAQWAELKRLLEAAHAALEVCAWSPADATQPYRPASDRMDQPIVWATGARAQLVRRNDCFGDTRPVSGAQDCRSDARESAPLGAILASRRSRARVAHTNKHPQQGPKSACLCESALLSWPLVLARWQAG